MYLGFNLEESKDYSEWYQYGLTDYNKNKNQVQRNLKQYLIDETSTLNGIQMEDDWFPKLNADIFLSHSHKDEKVAIGFAGWIRKTFGLSAFIDSTVWGYSNDLLKIVDDEYCKNPTSESYNYNKRNYSTSHIHILLSMALAKMIDKAEIVVFLNSENSIKPVSETILQASNSPWIYSELVLTNLIEKKQPDRDIMKSLDKRIYSEAESLDIAYDLSHYINSLIPLSQDNLSIWETTYNQNRVNVRHPLDYLYSQFKH